jgi:pimeloyl-ACP methyl ester carboxylesterase
MRPVVMLHGFAGSYERTWRQTGVADLVADLGRPVVGIDLLGHGEAPKPHEPEAYAELAARARADIDEATGGEVADVVAFSLGAHTVLELAASTPERFGTLVLGGVGSRLFDGRDPEQVALAMEREPDPEDVVARHFRVIADVPGNDPQVLVDALPAGRLVILPRTDHAATPEAFSFIDVVMDALGG